MKALVLFVLALLAAFVTPVVTAYAAPVRYTGEALETGKFTTQSVIQNSYGNYNYSPSTEFLLENMLWAYDIETDGASVRINEVSLSFSGTLELNFLSYLEIEVSAKVSDVDPGELQSQELSSFRPMAGLQAM